MLVTTRGNGALGSVSFAAGPVRLTGNLEVPIGARGLVLYSTDACDSKSPWTTEWVEELRACSLAVLCFDLLTACEKAREQSCARLRFDIPLLRARWFAATRWTLAQVSLRGLPLGYLAADAGVAAALSASARAPAVRALVCMDRHARFSDIDLKAVRAPTLLLVSRSDHRAAARRAAAWFERHLPSAIPT